MQLGAGKGSDYAQKCDVVPSHPRLCVLNCNLVFCSIAEDAHGGDVVMFIEAVIFGGGLKVRDERRFRFRPLNVLEEVPFA